MHNALTCVPFPTSLRAVRRTSKCKRLEAAQNLGHCWQLGLADLGHLSIMSASLIAAVPLSSDKDSLVAMSQLPC